MINEVTLHGITHSPSDHEASDGDLGTCLNLIPENSALRPIYKGSEAESFQMPNDTCTIALVHKVTHDAEIHSHYIVHCANASPFSWYYTERGGDGTPHQIDLGDFKVNAVTAVGNILCFVGDEKTIYAFWSGDHYTPFDHTAFSYSAVISNQKSEEINVSANLGDTWSSAFEKNSHFNNNVDVSLKGVSIIFSDLDALVNKKLEERGKEWFKYTSFGVLAVRLYDGTSYINISNPFILAPETSFNKFIWRQETTSCGTITSIHTHTINVSMDIPEGLEDLIQGIDVFLCAPDTFIDTEKLTRGISRYKCYIWNDKMASGVNCDTFAIKSKEDVYQTLENKSFYLSVSIPKEKFGTDVQLKRIQQVEESLSLADMKRSTFGGQCAITNNNRLHLGNIRQTIFNAFDTELITSRKKISDTQLYLNAYYDLPSTKTSTTDCLCDAVYKVSLRENGVQREVYYSGQLQYPISPILAYPSTLATTMEIFFFLPKYNKYFCKKMQLHQSDSFGMSYYLNISTDRTTPTAVDRQSSSSLENQGFADVSFRDPSPDKDELDDYMYLYHDDAGLPAFIQLYRYKLLRKEESGGSFGNSKPTTKLVYYWDDTPIDTGDLTEITKSEFDAALAMVQQQSKYVSQHPNVVKVSEAENPLVFPASASVQVGSSIISAMATNTQPISEGQFGYAPLYAFTDEGVWVLTVTDQGTYDARQPAKRDICSNPKGILQIDDAVLFPTEQGVMMQTGRESKCITDSLDGYPFDFSLMPAAAKVLAKAGVEADEVKYLHFREFMKSADMIYSYYDHRIILFSPLCGYAYVYSIKSGLWGVMQSNIVKRVNIYPEAYAIDSNRHIVNLYQEHPEGDTPYMFCTRPLGLNAPDIHKTVFSLIARGYFRKSADRLGMVLYGSNDLFHWHAVGSSVDRYLRGLAGSPYKYFRIAAIGSLSPDESIQGFSIDYQQRWQNKLR